MCAPQLEVGDHDPKIVMFSPGDGSVTARRDSPATIMMDRVLRRRSRKSKSVER